jgi:hypothetical protein
MLTVLTQMPAFISVNGVNAPHRPADACGNLDSRFNQHVRPDLEKSTAASSPKSYLVQLAKIIWQRSCRYGTISVGKLKDLGRKAETFLLAPV